MDKKLEQSKNLPVFLKWAGGKSQILDELVKRFPKKFNRYFEPFVGAGTVFFYIKKFNKVEKCFISDINEELINVFKVVKKRPNELIDELKIHKENYQKDKKNYYYHVRKMKPIDLSDVENAARFIFLNKTCWNGLYRVNSKGKFNVPMGGYKNPRIFDIKEIKQASHLLRNVSIRKSDFSSVLKSAKDGDFIYFDPPYQPISKTSSFTSYTKNAFDEEDQKKLAEVFQKLAKKGCLVMLSNSDSELIRKLYKYFKIHVVKARRIINCQGDKRGPINELVITNY